jgi:ribonucleotide monophosphatase NagD (HAD superfamily)
MFGDNMETDIAFGNNNNFAFTVLVETGIHKLSDVVKYSSDPSKQKYVPSHHISSLSQLNNYL